MALGQLLDYRHYIKPDAQLAVLLPAQAPPTITEVLHAHRVGVIYPDAELSVSRRVGSHYRGQRSVP